MDLHTPGGESSHRAMERAVASMSDLLALGHRTYVVATHGNLMALQLKHYDASFGFSHWQQLTNPDV